MDVDDLLTLIVNWGDCASDDLVCKPDIDNDDDVDVDDLIAVILGVDRLRLRQRSAGLRSQEHRGSRV